MRLELSGPLSKSLARERQPLSREVPITPNAWCTSSAHMRVAQSLRPGAQLRAARVVGEPTSSNVISTIWPTSLPTMQPSHGPSSH
jgi:hypothetical protein